jgi:hypothetical protein
MVAPVVGNLNRRDIIIARRNLVDRRVELLLVAGVPASNPAAPALVRNDDYWDIQLASVYVPQGATEILQANITDTRMDEDLCGICKSLVDTIDFSQFAIQFADFFAGYEASVQQRYQLYDAAMGQRTDDAAEAYAAWLATLGQYKDGAEADFGAWFQHIQDVASSIELGELAGTVVDMDGRLDAIEGSLEQMPRYNQPAQLGVCRLGAMHLGN